MEQRSVVSADGTHIVWTTLASAEDVVICPGSLSDGTNWMPVAQQLADAMTVHVRSRRGTGASGDAAEHSIQRESEDVVAVLVATEARRLVGHTSAAGR